MLRKNIDAADGLVNGVCGTVTHIVRCETGNFPSRVFVKFDDDVGRQRRKQAVGVSPELIDSVGIVPEEEKLYKPMLALYKHGLVQCTRFKV